MSLSDDDSSGNREGWGTIFTPSGEQNLGGVEQGRSTAWTEKDESDYLERVRKKAGDHAAQIIAAATAEAEHIRTTARQEGYDAGLAQARQELDEFRFGMSESVQAVLGAIEGQCSSIFEQWRAELVDVVRLAVRKISGLELAERRNESLDALLSEAINLLEKRRELVIRVNPEDEPALNDIVITTQERFSDVKSWRVRADASISPGGLVVESESSLVEGRIESREALVDEVLSRLTLPEHPGLDHAGAEHPAPQSPDKS